jgi:hypothetical protein
MGIPRLLRHLVDQDAQNLHPAASTRALHVFGWNQTDPKQLPSLVRFMPNLRVFSCKYLAVTVPCLVALQKRSRLILREFEATVYDDVRAVLSHIGQFEALQTLHLWVGVGTRPSGQALPTMRLGSLRSLLISTAPGDLFEVAQWLARCEFGSLQKFFYVSPTCMPGSTDARVPADLSPMASFFAAQRSMHTLAFDTSDTYEAIVGLLSQRFPPALELVDFGVSMIPAELPPFPRSIQRLSFQTDPGNLGALWSTFDILLNQKRRLPPGLRIAFDDMCSERPELARFRWRDFLRPGAISTDMLSEADTDRNKMVLYAKQFERIGVSIIDEDDCVWPPQGSSGECDLDLC